VLLAARHRRKPQTRLTALMLRNENRVEVRRSPEDVFAFIADLRNEPRYVPNVVETKKIADGPHGVVGTQYREVTRVMLGRKTTATYVVTEFTPPQTFAFRGKLGRSTFHGRWVLAAGHGGTTATITAEATMAWPMRYIERFVRRSVAATFAQMVANLKRVLEAESASANTGARVSPRRRSSVKTARTKPAATRRARAKSDEQHGG
jgi:hypothetical protein